MRVIIARELALRVTAGSTRAPQVSKLEDGNHPSPAAKITISISPSQKFGMATPISAKTIDTESKIEYCRIAQMMPKGSPSATPSTTAQKASFSVVGKRVRISSLTDDFVT